MRRILFSITAGFALIAIQALPVKAAIISIQPSEETVDVGETVTVDLVVSELAAGEIISSYDLDLTYDNSIVSYNDDATFGASLAGLPMFQVANEYLPGAIEMVELSLESDAALQGLQSDSFTLATLSFTAAYYGSTSLDLSAINIVGLGAADITFDTSLVGGLINVQPSAIPELDGNAAGSALVFLLGSVFVFSARRRRS